MGAPERPAVPVGFLLAGLLAVGCDPPPEAGSPPEGQGTAEGEVVLSSEPAWEEGEGWTVAPEPALTVGVLEGGEEYQLVDVADAARRSDGSLVVVDRGARTVRLYDSGGTFLHVLGGSGSGPGEFTNPDQVLVGPGDTVTVWDQDLLRITRFGPGGGLAGTRTVDWGGLMGGLEMGGAQGGGGSKELGKGWVEGLYPGPMAPLADGSLLVRLVEKTASPPSSGLFRPRSGALQVSRDLSEVDTLGLFGDPERYVVDAPWGPFAVGLPLARGTLLAHGGNPPTICLGDQAAPEVVCIGPDGEGTRVRWVQDPIPISGEEMEAWRARMVEALAPKLGRVQVLEVLDQVPRPEFRPPFSNILLDSEGNLWVERGPGSDGLMGHLVFDPRGILLGRVALPPIRVLEIGEGHVLGVHRDELEVQYLHLYELIKPPA